MTTLSLKLPDEMAARIDALARKRGVSRSALIRAALESMMAGRRGRDTFSERAAELVGSLSGPGDLSTNRKHMDGFGR